jgi:hypothetical protein
MVANAEIDVAEVAEALDQMFAVFAACDKEEPDPDRTMDILKEYFPGITMQHLVEAREILNTRRAAAEWLELKNLAAALPKIKAEIARTKALKKKP